MPKRNHHHTFNRRSTISSFNDFPSSTNDNVDIGATQNEELTSQMRKQLNENDEKKSSSHHQNKHTSRKQQSQNGRAISSSGADWRKEFTQIKRNHQQQRRSFFIFILIAAMQRMLTNKRSAAIGLLTLICAALFIAHLLLVNSSNNRHIIINHWLAEPLYISRHFLCSLPLLDLLDRRFLNGHFLGCRYQQGRLANARWPKLMKSQEANHPLAMLIAEEEQQQSLFVYSDEDGLILHKSSLDKSQEEESIEQQKREIRQWREAEAVAALNAAKRSRNEGNLRKAKSIIEHAYSLAPYNPDILTEYGVFFETIQRDVVEADGFYLKALNRNPQHREALIRRQRALPLVEEIDNRMMREINRKRDKFMRIPRTDSGLKRAMRESYFQHVYHTVAMEGNTINLAQTRSILETRMAVGGKSIIEHNEILGLDAALRWLNQSLMEVNEITLEHILALHKRVLGYADPMSAGQLRTIPVFVGNFRPPDAQFVPSEMAELIQWLNDEETLGLDPVEAAALAHYKLVFIHPFTDGNGRTGRLLMNWILLRAGFPPVIIPVELRYRYYQVLREANDGDLRPFIRFIAELTERTLDGFISSAISTTMAAHDAENGGTEMCEIDDGKGGEKTGNCHQQQRDEMRNWEEERGAAESPPPPFCTP